MSTTIDVLFVAFGFFAIGWALAGNGHWALRVLAGLFGIIVVVIGTVLAAALSDSRRCDRRWD
jgi:hypothetical protein